MKQNSFQAWLVCFSAALFFFYEFIQMHIFSSLDPYLMQAFNIHATELGLLKGCYFWSNVLFLLPAGLILDRFSTRKIIMLTLGICILGTFGFALTNNYHVAMLSRFLSGIGSAFCFLSSIRLASRWFPDEKIALVTGLIVTMAMTGGMVAQTPLALLVKFTGWREALLLDAGLGIVILAVVAWKVIDSPSGKMTPPSFKVSDYVYSMKKAYGRTQNWLAAIYTCLMNLPIFLLGGAWGGLYLHQVRHLSSIQASYVTNMIFLGAIIGCPLAGSISERLRNRCQPMVVGAVISTLFIISLMYTQHLGLFSLMAIFFCLGFMTSTQIISYPLVVESNPKVITATAVSVISFTTQGGGAVFIPLFGKLMDKNWNHLVIDGVAHYAPTDFLNGLAIMPIGFTIALAATILIRETYCRRVSDDMPLSPAKTQEQAA